MRCSPFALDHQKEITGFLLAETLANLAGVCRTYYVTRAVYIMAGWMQGTSP